MSAIIDPELILSINEEWMKLEEDWKTVDLETDDDYSPSKLTPVFSSLDLRKTTFDSSFLLKEVRRKIGRQLSKTSDLVNYREFIQDLEKKATKDFPAKQFYYINGQIISAISVEDICDKIDDIFKSVEKLSSATSTIRLKKKFPERISCSISTGGLSFDDTENMEGEKEKSDSDDVDRFIDEAFQQLSETMATLSEEANEDDEISRESVTTLVRKFSNILNSPAVIRNPKKKRECCDRFKELAEFWSGKAFDKCD